MEGYLNYMEFLFWQIPMTVCLNQVIMKKNNNKGQLTVKSNFHENFPEIQIG